MSLLRHRRCGFGLGPNKPPRRSPAQSVPGPRVGCAAHPPQPGVDFGKGESRLGRASDSPADGPRTGDQPAQDLGGLLALRSHLRRSGIPSAARELQLGLVPGRAESLGELEQGRVVRVLGEAIERANAAAAELLDDPQDPLLLPDGKVRDSPAASTKPPERRPSPARENSFGGGHEARELPIRRPRSPRFQTTAKSPRPRCQRPSGRSRPAREGSPLVLPGRHLLLVLVFASSLLPHGSLLPSRAQARGEEVGILPGGRQAKRRVIDGPLSSHPGIRRRRRRRDRGRIGLGTLVRALRPAGSAAQRRRSTAAPTSI